MMGGGRCTRNCFNCPICSASLSVTATGEGQTGPFILLCPHCLWSTQDIGIDFEKPAAIAAQLAAKLKAASARTPSALEPPDSTATRLSTGSYFPQPSPLPPPDAEESDSQAFARTKAHYLQQKQANKDEFGPSGSLLRLMDIYGNKYSKPGPVMFPMRTQSKGKVEWQEIEHIREVDAEEELIQRIKKAGFSGTTSQFQRIAHPHQPKLLGDLRPIAALLRTKRSRRCRLCRHILVKPESKVNAIRYRIRLIASFVTLSPR
jgi:dynactin-4